ncbi:translation initiation factor IF-2 [bacterium]|nr:MAG: translation initiation factor IF-2 [bacterium]
MSQGTLKLFKAAKEYNVSTTSLVDTLASKGFTIENKPMATLSNEMVSALDEVYGVDKKKSQQFERTREEYQDMRSQFKSRQNQTVSLDSPIGIDPIDNLMPLEAEDKPSVDELFDLQPIEEKQKEAPKAEKQAEPVVEQKTEEKPAPVVEKKEEKVAEVFEKIQEKPVVEKPVTEEKPKVVQSEKPAEAVKEEQVVTTTEEEDAEIIRARTEKLKGTKVIGKINIKKNFERTPESRDNAQQGGKRFERRDRNAQVGPRPERREDGGQRPVGSSSPDKIKPATPQAGAAQDSNDPNRNRKKRLKKRDSADSTSSTSSESTPSINKPTKPGATAGTPGQTAPSSDSSAGRRDKNKKGKSGKPEVDEEEVDSKMRETMMKLQGGASASKKRSKLRKKKREDMAAEREEAEMLAEIEKNTILEVAEFITVSELAELLNIQVTQIITSLMSIGIMVSINQRLDASNIELIAGQFGKEVRFITADELLEEEEEIEDDPASLSHRAPVVTIMGHVDHGKTSLLDHIRRTRVAAGEAGGITQHIGAYSVTLEDGRKIAFLDTPGHEAFTAMRARGAQVTDIVILVVAADDSVMPQTVEAINHAQAAGVPLVVAINKIDKAEANPGKIKQQLTEYNVVVEEYGGNVQTAEVSAKQGIGIDELLEKVLVEAELLDLKANADRLATGIVLESRVDKGKGVVANVLVQNGTLEVGDVFIAGQFSGRVRAMENELGQRLQEAGPSTPIQLTGFDGLPQAGDKLVGMHEERKAKELAIQRQQIKREQSIRMVKHMTLDDLSRRMALGEVSDLNIIIKGDVDGSIEALAGSLQKLSTDEVKVKIIHTGVGAISESDVLLATASDAIIIGFQVRPSANARKLAEQESIDVRLFSVIYDAVDEVKEAMEGLLSPELKEKVIATVQVRETFKVPNVGTVAGCYVTDGKVVRGSKIRLIRDGIVVYNGEMNALRRFKDDVKEVASGYECGISIHNYNDIKIGDIIEAYEQYEVKRKLS